MSQHRLVGNNAFSNFLNDRTPGTHCPTPPQARVRYRTLTYTLVLKNTTGDNTMDGQSPDSSGPGGPDPNRDSSITASEGATPGSGDTVQGSTVPDGAPDMRERVKPVIPMQLAGTPLPRVYTGRAQPRTAPEQTVWAIQKIHYTVSNVLTKVIPLDTKDMIVSRLTV